MMEGEDELVRTVSRLCGVAIALLIIIPIFNYFLNIDYREFFATVAQPVFVAAVER